MFIAEAIESVLNQTYHHFELIIVDDCSKDKTVEIANSFASRDNRVKCYVNEKNLGDYPNRNKAASLATGYYIMYVDSDDSIQPNAIRYIIESFNKFPSALHSAIYHENDLIAPTMLDSALAIRNHYFTNNSLAGGPGSRVFKKEYFIELFGYPEKYGPANDMYFNILSTAKSPILMLPYCYLNYRIHEGQEKNNHEAYIYNNYNYLDDLINSIQIPLSPIELKILIKGNKRRFIINVTKYFFQTLSFKSLKIIFKKVNFRVFEILQAI